MVWQTWPAAPRAVVVGMIHWIPSYNYLVNAKRAAGRPAVLFSVPFSFWLCRLSTGRIRREHRFRILLVAQLENCILHLFRPFLVRIQPLIRVNHG